ncbi:hypothetical protein PG990_013511 [Apiospora arundinis]
MGVGAGHAMVGAGHTVVRSGHAIRTSHAVRAMRSVVVTVRSSHGTGSSASSHASASHTSTVAVTVVVASHAVLGAGHTVVITSHAAVVVASQAMVGASHARGTVGRTQVVSGDSGVSDVVVAAHHAMAGVSGIVSVGSAAGVVVGIQQAGVVVAHGTGTGTAHVVAGASRVQHAARVVVVAGHAVLASGGVAHGGVGSTRSVVPTLGSVQTTVGGRGAAGGRVVVAHVILVVAMGQLGGGDATSSTGEALLAAAAAVGGGVVLVHLVVADMAAVVSRAVGQIGGHAAGTSASGGAGVHAAGSRYAGVDAVVIAVVGACGASHHTWGSVVVPSHASAVSVGAGHAGTTMGVTSHTVRTRHVVSTSHATSTSSRASTGHASTGHASCAMVVVRSSDAVARTGHTSSSMGVTSHGGAVSVTSHAVVRAGKALIVRTTVGTANTRLLLAPVRGNILLELVVVRTGGVAGASCAGVRDAGGGVHACSVARASGGRHAAGVAHAVCARPGQGAVLTAAVCVIGGVLAMRLLSVQLLCPGLTGGRNCGVVVQGAVLVCARDGVVGVGAGGGGVAGGSGGLLGVLVAVNGFLNLSTETHIE